MLSTNLDATQRHDLSLAQYLIFLFEGSNSMERVPNDPSHYTADGDSISLGSGDSGGRMFLPQCPPGVEIVPLGKNTS